MVVIHKVVLREWQGVRFVVRIDMVKFNVGWHICLGKIRVDWGADMWVDSVRMLMGAVENKV